MSKASIFTSEWEDLIRRAALGAGALPGLFDRITSMESNLMEVLERLRQEVAEVKSVNASVLTLLSGVAEKLASASASEDWAAVGALSEELSQETDKLAAAVAANTPAAAELPTPVEAPVEGGEVAPEVPPAEPAS